MPTSFPLRLLSQQRGCSRCSVPRWRSPLPGIYSIIYLKQGGGVFSLAECPEDSYCSSTIIFPHTRPHVSTNLISRFFAFRGSAFFPSNARWLSPDRLSSRKDNCILQIHRIRSVATSVLSTMCIQKRTELDRLHNPLSCHRANQNSEQQKQQQSKTHKKQNKQKKTKNKTKNQHGR